MLAGINFSCDSAAQARGIGLYASCSLHTFAAQTRSPLKLESPPLKLGRWPIPAPVELGRPPFKLAVLLLKLGVRCSSSKAWPKKLRRPSSEKFFSIFDRLV